MMAGRENGRGPLVAKARRAARHVELYGLWVPRMPIDALRARRYQIAGPYKRIYLFHVRKTGGTSLVNGFLGLGGETPRAIERRMNVGPHLTSSSGYLFAGYDRQVIERGDYFFGWSHHPAWTLSLRPQTFTITILRDPVNRIVSRYRHLADERADRHQVFGASEAERAWASDGFDAFVERLPSYDLFGQLHMFSELLDPEEAAALIRTTTLWFFTEHYGLGLDALASRLELPLDVRGDRKSVSSDQPSAAALRELRDRLDPEYRLLDLLRADPGPGLVGSVPG
jgi:hypothetical protein